MSDLPDVKNGASSLKISYSGEPQSHFQRLVSTWNHTNTNPATSFPDPIPVFASPHIRSGNANAGMGSGNELAGFVFV